MESINEDMGSFTGHILRADYHHVIENQPITSLAILPVVMDFRENIPLTPQNEIESTNWTIKQVNYTHYFWFGMLQKAPVISKSS